jgi:predicted component of type VI protein secretion system
MRCSTAAPRTAATFAAVRRLADSALAQRSDKIAFDAYLTFEQVETEVRAKKRGLASDLETTFGWLRTRAARADDAERHAIRNRLLAGLERAERVVSDRPSADEPVRRVVLPAAARRLRGDSDRGPR